MLQTLLNSFDEFAALIGRNIKNQYYKIDSDYYKVKNIIESCQCIEHLDVANRCITLFYNKYLSNYYLDKLERIYKSKKQKL
jgi:hypothetical protein